MILPNYVASFPPFVKGRTMTTPNPSGQQSTPDTTQQQTPQTQPPPPPPPSTDTTKPPVHVHPAGPDHSGTLSEIKSAIAGLPETLVNAFQEAVKPAVDQQQQQQASTTTNTTGQQAQSTPAATEPPAQAPRRQSFAEWWHNGPRKS